MQKTSDNISKRSFQSPERTPKDQLIESERTSLLIVEEPPLNKQKVLELTLKVVHQCCFLLDGEGTLGNTNPAQGAFSFFATFFLLTRDAQAVTQQLYSFWQEATGTLTFEKKESALLKLFRYLNTCLPPKLLLLLVRALSEELYLTMCENEDLFRMIRPKKRAKISSSTLKLTARHFRAEISPAGLAAFIICAFWLCMYKVPREADVKATMENTGWRFPSSVTHPFATLKAELGPSERWEELLYTFMAHNRILLDDERAALLEVTLRKHASQMLDDELKEAIHFLVFCVTPAPILDTFLLNAEHFFCKKNLQNTTISDRFLRLYDVKSHGTTVIGEKLHLLFTQIYPIDDANSRAHIVSKIIKNYLPNAAGVRSENLHRDWTHLIVNSLKELCLENLDHLVEFIIDNAGALNRYSLLPSEAKPTSNRKLEILQSLIHKLATRSEKKTGTSSSHLA